MKVLPTFFVAVAVAIIAWRQYSLARAKLNLDLYERRYKIFEATWSFLSNPDLSRPLGMSPEFTNLFPQARFLFGVEIEEYMKKASNMKTQLSMIDMRTRAHNNFMSPEDIEAHTEISNYFFNEASVGCRTVFGKYLDFSKWS